MAQYLIGYPGANQCVYGLQPEGDYAAYVDTFASLAVASAEAQDFPSFPVKVYKLVVVKTIRARSKK